VQRCNQKVADLFVYRTVTANRNFRGWIPAKEKREREWKALPFHWDNFLDVLGKLFDRSGKSLTSPWIPRWRFDITHRFFAVESTFGMAHCKITGYRVPKRRISFQHSWFIPVRLMIVTRFPVIFSSPKGVCYFLCNKYIYIWYYVCSTTNKKNSMLVFSDDVVILLKSTNLLSCFYIIRKTYHRSQT